MQNYTKYTFNSTNEILVARLFDLGFDSFQELENSSEGYIRDDMITVELNASVNEIAKEYDAEYVVEKLENKNWNEIWEANFEPVTVGKFCAVRADFHEANGSVANDIIINPKMAFGTGHHETTYMMIDTMSDLDFEGKSVFDFGCGTAVLAILAKRLGSARTLAIDIERESASNSAENAAVNNVEGIDIRQAVIQDLEPDKFNIVLANINRKVLLNTADMIASHQNKGDILLVSGVMHQDEQIVETRFNETGYKRHSIKSRGDWLCIRYSRH
ncbi:MAG TPA: 50S ribosomal protein L11 methyltransferase [Saprospirales bacterium]|jgi:ribosomal protein L11 methyltransferase|nr:50S ribosomal protein L11 methyltransferase [Saprospiraceae bacterium]HAI57943.1 50S ribosomal protein L11 methyltransferase [Saprospirales bacterium]MDA9181717.1 50S ribosomal protein L11 methyltransferase [Saprospiraceae bacterium]MDG1101401.1 50S ribosomal protein L11 methyltransferase [Saprospiraceae bacterium]MDG1716666.1 50S ribosomal protein L11 methyltransferase [Saprospiraceae bacterium]|tara:strand:+ start:2082 stop:2900 length:819 start_codon:yes stop_codon:yes gene_type:complete